MAVLIRHRAEGMTEAQYDEISPPLIEKLKTQPGFLFHTAFTDNGQFTVSEISGGEICRTAPQSSSARCWMSMAMTVVLWIRPLYVRSEPGLFFFRFALTGEHLFV